MRNFESGCVEFTVPLLVILCRRSNSKYRNVVDRHSHPLPFLPPPTPTPRTVRPNSTPPRFRLPRSASTAMTAVSAFARCGWCTTRGRVSLLPQQLSCTGGALMQAYPRG